jgi:tripartite-type tricarboxylate transporter receptor subunit TctC
MYKIIFSAALSGTLGLLGATQTLAQTWPSQPIKMIVPIAVGSVTDVASRFLAKEMTEKLGQPVVVVNRPGGNMMLGAQECAQAAPDGYTICVTGADAMSYNPFTIGKLSYDPDKDFRPVTNMYFVMEAILAKEALPVNSIDELKKAAVAAPGKYNFGTLGSGSTIDTFRRWLNDAWKTEFVPIPFKGGSEIINSLLAGESDVSRIGLGNIAGYLNDKRIKVLAVRSGHRLPQIPNAPTTGEVGLGDYPGVPWWGMVVPAKTPDAIAARLNRDVVDIMKSKPMQDFMASQFLEPSFGSPEEFAKFLQEDRKHAGELIGKYPSAN